MPDSSALYNSMPRTRGSVPSTVAKKNTRFLLSNSNIWAFCRGQHLTEVTHTQHKNIQYIEMLRLVSVFLEEFEQQFFT